MKIIDRYLLKEFLSLFSLTLASLISLYLLVDFIERIDDLAEHQAPLPIIAQYFLLKIPQIIYTVTPFSVLISTILTLSILSHHMEVTAMRALGVAHLAIVKPILLSSLIISVLTLFINETIAPETNRMVKKMNEQWIEGKVQTSTFQSDKVWLKGKEGFFNINLIDSKNGILMGFTLFQMGDGFTITSRIDARLANWEKDHWNFKDVTISNFSEDGSVKVSQYPELAMELSEKLDDFQKLEKNADEMGFQELWGYIRRLQEEGYFSLRYTVDLYNKISFPFASFILPLLGIPFAMMRVESGGAAAGIGLGVILSFAFWVTTALSTSLGYGELLPPIVAAWIPNLIFGTLGVLMYTYIEQ
jgi:lipopolysaccharide export system permease protein